MPTELFVAHRVVAYEGHDHLSVHLTRDEAVAKARELAAESKGSSDCVLVTRSEVGRDLTHLDGAEEIKV